MKPIFLATIVLYVLLYSTQVKAQGHNRLGGFSAINEEGKIYFYTKEINDVWWLIDPAGNGFISKGINGISFRGDHTTGLQPNPYYQSNLDRYQTQDYWADTAIERVKQWHFNTLGAWSDTLLSKRGMPYVLNLEIAKQANLIRGNQGFPDVFSDAFSRTAKRIARLECKPRQQDLLLIGYFTDHFLHWELDSSGRSVLEAYLSQKPETPGKQAAIQFLENKYIAIDQLNQSWGTEIKSFSTISQAFPFPESDRRHADQMEFLLLVSEQYAKVCYEVIKEQDPNHLILGSRINLDTPVSVVQGVKDHIDVLSVNVYSQNVFAEKLNQLYEISHKPILISEFTYLQPDSIQNNAAIVYHSVTQQQKRARFYERFVTDALQLPFVIGYHWFQYSDRPGVDDFANLNYGLVDLQDNPYDEFVNQIKQMNLEADAIHQQAQKLDE